MKIVSTHLGLTLALCAPSFSLLAQAPADALDTARSSDHRIMLRYSKFDPMMAVPEVPGTLHSAADTLLWIVQFHGAPTDEDRAAVMESGGRILGALPYDAQIVHMTAATATAVSVLRQVRWVGPYEPAYRLEAELLTEHLSGAEVPVRQYNIVMADKRTEKKALEGKILAIGGKVIDRQMESLLFTVELTGAQLLMAARFDEVLYIDRKTEIGVDMNNARIQGGANYIETQAGYAGQGVIGHIYEGCEWNHPDFTPAMTNVLSGGQPQRHGHCTTGIVFGDGNSAASARGMAPEAVGFYTNYASVTAGWSRNAVIDVLVNSNHVMFTTASWGGAQTPQYTSISADADDIVFDHRIPWTNSMSNLGNTNVRPEAWAKNVISVGGVQHFNNSSAADDSWLAGNGSTGPAQDGRNKPDLAAYYDQVWTSDLSAGVDNGEGTGATGGYNTAAGIAGQSYTGFNGTSSATPIVAGHNALAIQMYTDGIFNNPLPASPTVGNRFVNRPLAQTLKALQIVAANMYTPTATNNRREHVGWGFPSLANMYDRRNRMFIVPEDAPITQGSTHTYKVSVLTGETALKVCMTYLDPAGNPAAAIDRINDLTLRVIAPNGTTSYWGNVGLMGAGQANVSSTGGSANTVDTVECVFLNNPTPGNWTIQITAPTIAQDANVATAATDATYALVVNGGRQAFGSGCARYFPDTNAAGSGNSIPFGTNVSSQLSSVFGNNNWGSAGGAAYFNVTVTNGFYLTGFDLNTKVAAGGPLFVDVYRTALGGGYGGNENNPAAWTPISAGKGVAAGLDLPSTIELGQPTLFSAGTYGIAIVARNFPHYYTNGTGANQTYTDANVTASFGATTNVPFSGPINSPRVANINLRYLLDTQSWTNQRYQTILRREELGAAGTIHSLSFSAETSQKHWNSSLVIRMAQVPAGTALSTNFGTNLPSPTTVLSASNYTFHTIADGWTDVGLQTGFAYDGLTDVVVDIIARGNVASINAARFNSSSTQERVFNYGWTGIFAPLTGTYGATAGLRMRVGFNCGTNSIHGSSCGPLRAARFGTPTYGGAASFDVYDAIPNDGVLLGLGFSNGAPYPVSLSSYGFTNCFIWNDLSTTLFKLTDGAGHAFHDIYLPNNPAFTGLRVYGQWFQLDATQPGGLTASDYLMDLVGIYP
jgi:serine protease AprX